MKSTDLFYELVNSAANRPSSNAVYKTEFDPWSRIWFQISNDKSACGSWPIAEARYLPLTVATLLLRPNKDLMGLGRVVGASLAKTAKLSPIMPSNQEAANPSLVSCSHY